MQSIDPKLISSWQQRFAQREAESLALAERARADLPEAVQILKKYGAKRIVLFGSLCNPDRFHPGSDIDLAVEGIPSRDFNRAAADVLMALEYPVDLKPMEKLAPLLRSMIREKGETIYAV
ncbi:MAG: nucleotidyltransferase domain-containing protein [Deltaproteobacteria bacterium]|nr:nucleotidyltransferase domain-containing protein [Deltaproteobacteria bacterium]